MNRQRLQSFVQAELSGSANCFPLINAIQFEQDTVCDISFIAQCCILGSLIPSFMPIILVYLL